MCSSLLVACWAGRKFREAHLKTYCVKTSWQKMMQFSLGKLGLVYFWSTYFGLLVLLMMAKMKCIGEDLVVSCKSCVMHTWSNGQSMYTLWYRWPTSALKSKIGTESIWNRKAAERTSNLCGLVLLTFSVFVTVEQFYILLTGGNSVTLRSVKTLNLIGWKENSEGQSIWLAS